MLKRIFPVLLIATATPSMATEWMHCSAPEGEAEIGLLIGMMDVLAPVGITLKTPVRKWSSAPPYGEGDATTVGQAYTNGDVYLVDLYDGDVNNRVAELRLSRAQEGDTTAFGGTLRVIGVNAWAVSCDGF